MKADREKAIVAFPVLFGSKNGSPAGTGMSNASGGTAMGVRGHVVIDELTPCPPVAGLGPNDRDGNGLGINQVGNFTRALLVRARGRV